jgi:prevent-host-death family protein
VEVFFVEMINIQMAKTHLSALVEKAAAGDSFIIAKAGRPLVTVMPYKEPVKPSRTGFLKNHIAVPDDYDQMGCKEIEDLFEGGL